jgi:hypothetical protein
MILTFRSAIQGVLGKCSDATLAMLEAAMREAGWTPAPPPEIHYVAKSAYEEVVRERDHFTRLYNDAIHTMNEGRDNLTRWYNDSLIAARSAKVDLEKQLLAHKDRLTWLEKQYHVPQQGDCSQSPYGGGGGAGGQHNWTVAMASHHDKELKDLRIKNERMLADIENLRSLRDNLRCQLQVAEGKIRRAKNELGAST